MSRVALVTGSNKGIGYAIVKALCQKFDGIVYLTSRSEVLGKAAVNKLNKLGLQPEYHQLDVTNRDSVIALRDHIASNHGGLDILINNAGYVNSVLFNSYKEEQKVIDINYRGVLTMQELIYPMVRNNGRILNVSSDCGHLCNIRNKYWIDRLSKKDLKITDINEFVDWYLDSKKNGSFNPDDLVDKGSIAAYRVSKVALCALTMIQQKELEFKNISVNSVHPGFVRTDMTMKLGFLSTDEAAKTPVYLVLEAPETLRGAYVWHDGTVLDWFDHTANIYFTNKFARSWVLSSVIVNIKEYIFMWINYILEKVRLPITNKTL
ncbi:unnamed protein product [Pieris brassicae]|uniref:Uncharacterized protein n=1 Tax=Pieris brassicae TaxID=7116 RepID=A0A9P0WUR7_PIEBR|nr:unnamed protein product [Pieris brassicae]